jgi:eukaryotic-like serine/threonine-protein kinase
VSELLADRYELGSDLGSGGMARVVAAHDRVLDREVAVKLLTVPPDPAARERFLREARAAARLRHPNVVAVHDTGEHRGQPYIVMELVEGETLGDLLDREGPLEIEEAVAVTAGVLEVLVVAHEQGLLHRDVKPGNVLLPLGGGVKLADFGIAKAMDEATAGLTASGAVMGTATYLAPELVEGAAPSPASDVYSVGCLLYALLAGSPPFVGDNAVAVAYAQRHTPVPPIGTLRPEVPADLRGVLDRALAKDPAHRYQDAAAMLAALLGGDTEAPAAADGVLAPIPGAAIARDRTATLEADGPVQRGGTGRVRTLTAVLGAVGVALLLGLAGWWLVGALGGDDDALAGEETADDVGAEPDPDEEQAPEAEQAPGPDDGSDPGADGGDEDPAGTEPTTVDGLIALLAAAPPETYGEKHDDLLDDLVDLSRESDPNERAEEARDLGDDVRSWVEAGELDPEIGRIALAILDEVADG